MMTRQEYENVYHERAQWLGTNTYDALIVNYPINAWVDDDLKQVHAELMMARGRLTEELDRIFNAYPLNCVLREMHRRNL